MILQATVQGRGEITAKVYKHLAPVTLAKIQRALPLGGRVNFFERNFAYILTSVITGEEKSRLDIERGSVAFMPAGSMLCFFLKDTRSYKPMNLLGKVKEGLEVLENVRRGDSLRVESIFSASGNTR